MIAKFSKYVIRFLIVVFQKKKEKKKNNVV